MEKRADRDSCGAGLVCSEGWFFLAEDLTSVAASSLCQGPWVLGGEARCCVLPGWGGHLPGEATALLLSDPDFQPHTHSMFWFSFFFLLLGVLEGFFLFVCLVGWLVWGFFSRPPALFFHLFLQVLFWTSMPFSVLD